MAGSPLSVCYLHSLLSCKSICTLHISYFSAAVVKHHEQKQLTEGRVCLTCGSEGWESNMGGPAASDKHGSRNGKLRAHNFEHKHEAERVNSKWFKALTFKPTPSDVLPPSRSISTPTPPKKNSPTNTTKWWTNAHSWVCGGTFSLCHTPTMGFISSHSKVMLFSSELPLVLSFLLLWQKATEGRQRVLDFQFQATAHYFREVQVRIPAASHIISMLRALRDECVYTACWLTACS